MVFVTMMERHGRIYILVSRGVFMLSHSVFQLHVQVCFSLLSHVKSRDLMPSLLQQQQTV